MAIKPENKKKNRITIKDIIADVEKNYKWTGNILQMYAEKMFRYSISNEEVLKNDLSIKILKELEREVKNKEIISGQINAKPRMAKSTVAILLGKFIFGLLQKYKYKEKDLNFSMDNMARDQGERAKKMREPERMHDIIVTDESNALENTGENSTVEKAQAEVFSDVQAGRYVHGLFVCPEGTMDKNTDWKLEIRNKSNGMVHCRVYYYMRTSMYYGWVLIGIANFDVSKLIKNWLRVEPRFFEYLKNGKEKDKKYIEYWSKKDFYVEYMVKKYEKMELMNSEGIMHARDLDYAQIRFKVVTALKPLAELPFISLQRLRNNVKAKVETEFKRKKMPLSILGREQEAERVMSYLGMYRSLQEIRGSIRMIIKKREKNKITENEYEETIRIMNDARKEIENEIKINEEYLRRMIKLQEKYNEFKK